MPGACFCCMPDCLECGGAAAASSTKPPSISQLQKLDNKGSMKQIVSKSSVALASCSCFLPDCGQCNPGLQQAWPTQSTSDEQGTIKRQQVKPTGKKRKVPANDGRCKRTLQEDLRDDKAETVNLAIELEEARKIPATVRQSALQQIGRPLKETWLFLEVFAGCAALSLAVSQVTDKVVGPAIDSRTYSEPAPWRLRLDLTKDAEKTFLWQLILESRPWWTHVASECTLFTPMGRLTARRLPSEWRRLLDEAKGLFNFAMHLLLHQHQVERLGSWEQPPRRVNWKFQRLCHLLTLGFRKVSFPSCSYNMICLDTQKPIQKFQSMLSNADLSPLQRRCQCKGTRKTRHGRLEGVFRGPHEWAGARKTAWSGRYPTDLCTAMAKIIVESVA